MKSVIQAVTAMLILMFSVPSMAGGIIVENPYVRAIPPGQTISAAFMTLNNSYDSDIALVKASSDIARNVEMHEHVHKDGMMQMRQVPKISVPAKGKTALKPGGYHIMLIGLKKPIKPGDMIDLTLEFDNGDKLTIKADVRKIMMGMMKNKGGKPHHDMKNRKHDMSVGKQMEADKKAQMQAMKHANPMPNLMKVVINLGDQLNLSQKQAAALKKWRDERMPVVKKQVETTLKLEAELHQAALNDEPIEKIDELADSIMQNRIQIIRGKAFCRDNMKQILDKQQYQKVRELYSANFSGQ